MFRIVLKGMLAGISAIIFSGASVSAGWSGIRTSGAGTQGWQPIICESGLGWRSCELPVNITLVSSPPSLVATGQSSTVTATVTDYYGVAVPGNLLNWSTSDGTISANQTRTDASGRTAITLTSSRTLGGAAVFASTIENDGTGSVWVPFIDSFVAYPSSYTGWMENGGLYGCSAWNPDASTVDSGTWFTQTATCTQNYYRYRQDQQQSVVTGAITPVGGPVAEYTSTNPGISQSAVGTRYVAPPAPPEPTPAPPQPTQPSAPAATVCFSSSNSSKGVNQGTFFVASDLGGASSPKGAVQLYYNGATGLSIPSLSGSMVYNGMTLTAGAKTYTNNIGKNGLTWNWQVCQTPL